MALSRKGLTSGVMKALISGAIKGLTVFCVLLGRHAILYCSAMQSNTK
ncbi:unnamed protein product [Staurois parvus]|uniref:Uncharacterized protein n=1 Tax=Staurois parvus TaxID=386267 RepID=A0ABN9FEZ7_9NEOB|nr:unnamed protein product [Staurois parvus]